MMVKMEKGGGDSDANEVDILYDRKETKSTRSDSVAAMYDCDNERKGANESNHRNLFQKELQKRWQPKMNDRVESLCQKYTASIEFRCTNNLISILIKLAVFTRATRKG